MTEVPALGVMLLTVTVDFDSEVKVSKPSLIWPEIPTGCQFDINNIEKMLISKFPIVLDLAASDENMKATLIELFGPEARNFEQPTERWACLFNKIYFSNEDDATLYSLRFR